MANLVQSSPTTNDVLANTTNSFSFNSPYSSTLMVLLVHARGTASATPAISSITYNSKNLTVVTGADRTQTATNLYIRTSIYYIENPDYGSHTLTVTFDSACNSRLTVLTYKNAIAQIIEAGAGQSSSGTTSFTATLSRTSIATDFVVDALTTGTSATYTFGANQTEFYNNVSVGSASIARVSSSYSNTTGQTSMTVSASTTVGGAYVAAIVEKTGELPALGNFFLLF